MSQPLNLASTPAPPYERIEPQTWYVFDRLRRLESMLKNTVPRDKNDGELARALVMHARVMELLDSAECIVRTAHAA